MTVLVAETQAKADAIRGEGDGERNRIFAEAFGRDPDFFAFYRSMQAYESGLRASDTRLVLKPDSDFFRYFGSAAGKPQAPAAPAAGAAYLAAVFGRGASAAPRSRRRTPTGWSTPTALAPAIFSSWWRFAAPPS